MNFELSSEIFGEMARLRRQYDMYVTQRPQYIQLYQDRYTGMVDAIFERLTAMPLPIGYDVIQTNNLVREAGGRYMLDYAKTQERAAALAAPYLQARTEFRERYSLLLSDEQINELESLLRRYFFYGLDSGNWTWATFPGSPIAQLLSAPYGRVATPQFITDLEYQVGQILRTVDNHINAEWAGWRWVDAPHNCDDGCSFVDQAYLSLGRPPLDTTQQQLYLKKIARDIMTQQLYGSQLSLIEQQKNAVQLGINENLALAQRHPLLVSLMNQGYDDPEVLQKIYLIDAFGSEIALETVKLRQDAANRIADAQRDAESRVYQASIDAQQVRRDADYQAASMRMTLDRDLDSMLRDYQMIALQLAAIDG